MDALLSNPRALLLRRVVAHGAVGPVLVFAAYYLGAQIGFALQSPNAPQSVLWLPNSILLAVLLIVPFRRWPVYLAAAFPAQMLVSVGTGAPVEEPLPPTNQTARFHAGDVHRIYDRLPS